MIKNKKAFTLIELIVTIAVLGILVLLASPRFFGHTQNAELTKGFANARSIEKASELYYMDHKDWPRLTDDPYTSEEIESYSERIFDNTGHEVNLDPEGNYYDIDYDKLSDYIRVPDDKKNYILQNPVGKVFYMENLNEAGKSRVDYNQVIKNDEEQEDTFEFTATFTNAGSTGRTGPSQSQLDRAYAGTSLEGLVKSQNGIQLWTVPKTGNYRIEVYGAQGGETKKSGNFEAHNGKKFYRENGTFYRAGGKGAIMMGDFELSERDNINILVGQLGQFNFDGRTNGGGGGGGSFVTKGINYKTSIPLLVSGGGGGATAIYQQPNISRVGGNATTYNNGDKSGAEGSYLLSGGASYSKQINGGGQSFINGGTGGVASHATNNIGHGGFGSGAGGRYHVGGGGGGYSGGDGGLNFSTPARGGGSYNAGSNQANSVGNTGHGKVIITYIGE